MINHKENSPNPLQKHKDLKKNQTTKAQTNNPTNQTKHSMLTKIPHELMCSYTDISNQLEHLVAMDVVDGHDGVQCSIAHGVVPVTNVGCHFF